MNRAAPHCKPVEKRRAIQVEELAKEVLVQLHRTLGIAANGELNPRVEHDMSIAQPQHRRYAYIGNRVIGIALDDGRLVGKREGAAEIPLTEITADRHKIVGIVMKRCADLCYLLRTRRWQSPQELAVKLVDGGIFKDGFRIQVALDRDLPLERRAVFTGSLYKTALGNIVFGSQLVGVSKGGNRMHRVMPLGINIGPGKLIVIALLVIIGLAQRRQFLSSGAIVALGEVSVSQPDSDRVI